MKKLSLKTFRSPHFRGSLLLTILFLGASACEEDLIEHPKSIAVETFYNTTTEVETAVYAIYEPLNDTNITNSYLSILEPHGDYIWGNGGTAIVNDYAGLNANMIAKTERAWETIYLSIRNANLVIANAPEGTELTEEEKKAFVAEAKFLRAFNYFHLVRNWGGVPLRTEANLKEVAVDRSTEQQVYDLIIADLLEAEATLSDKSSPAGRANKWSAKAVLADVYLHTGQYDLAAQKADDVIKSGKFSLVPVATVDDWQKIFGSEAGVTKEEVFYIHTMRQAGFGNLWPMYLNHPKTKLFKRGGWFSMVTYTDNPMYANQNDADLRKGLWYLWDIGDGPNTLLNKKFIDPISPNAGNPLTWYRYADVLLIYAEAASRANNGPTAEAMEALNQVHRRAYGKNPKTASPVDYVLADYNADSFLDLVIREYGYEFQVEAKRWMQLKRSGKGAELILQNKGKVVQEAAWLFPIPAEEMNFNKALDPVSDQNPGY